MRDGLMTRTPILVRYFYMEDVVEMVTNSLAGETVKINVWFLLIKVCNGVGTSKIPA